MPGVYLQGWDSVAKKWVKIICDAAGKLMIDPTLILENPPTEDESKKAPSSEWAYDHWKAAGAHHVKYTDLEAQTACNLNGGLYWSCAGVHFDALNPAINLVTKSAYGYIRADADGISFLGSVNLPHGCTVSGCIVYGNDAAASESWYLNRVTLLDGTYSIMAQQSINTEDITITNPVINNSLYVYYLETTSFDTDDLIYGALIVYNL